MFLLLSPLDSLPVWASSRGSGETARMRRLAWTFAAHIGAKYQIRLTRPKRCFFCCHPCSFDLEICFTEPDQTGSQESNIFLTLRTPGTLLLKYLKTTGTQWDLTRVSYDKNEPRLMTKPTKCDSVPSEDSDQPGHLPSLISLHCALSGYLRTQAFFMWTAKALIRLGRCPGWSVFAGCICHFVGFVMLG